MHHKDYKRINVWLKDLRAKHYVKWIYSTDFAEKSKPAIYYLGINGIRCLKTLAGDDGTAVYPTPELRKRYREASPSRTFIDRCRLVAECCITLETKNNGAVPLRYTSVTEADYQDPDSDYHFLADSELVQPQLCFVKRERRRGDEEEIATTYLLEIFDATLPRYRLRKRLKDYVEFLDDGEWESETGDDQLPIVLLVCPSTTDLIYAKRRTRGLLAEDWDDDDDDRPRIRFATVEKLQEFGVTGKIWEEV